MKPKIGVCASAREFDEAALPKAREIGKEIAKHNCILVTGATIGVSYEAVKGAKEAGGETLGVSPAKDEKEQLEKYNYPIEGFDKINYTGLGISSRNVVFVKECNAIVIVSGRVGTLNELTIALAEHKIIGILEGTGGIADNAREIIELVKRQDETVFYSASPKELIEKIVKELG